MATDISSEQAATLRRVMEDWLSAQGFHASHPIDHLLVVAKVKELQKVFAEPFDDPDHCVHGDDCRCWHDD